MSAISSEIEAIVREFTARVLAAAKAQASERVLSAVSAALGEQGAFASVPPARIEKAERIEKLPQAEPGKRKLRLSPKGLAARKLQGQYLGLLRGLAAGPRARVKKVAREQGVAEALKFAASLK
ncbi:MAG: hypothetical protein ABSB49_16395 [Polyangia bacterium]|jgi:hypothetical protein